MIENQYMVIAVTGKVSAQLVQRVDRRANPCTILIMGPTGAGKSTYIESLGFNGPQKISCDRLDGFTQTISTYQLDNVTCNNSPIYVVDSPGFGDTKISELSIVSMLLQWMRDNNIVFDRIHYVTPINQVRLPGSRRRVLRTFEALTGRDTANLVTIVTTMWDTIHGETATNRAEETFRQLREDIWQDLIKKGGSVLKFTNTPESALAILDQCLGSTRSMYFNFENMQWAGQNIHDTEFASNIRGHLEDKIQSLQVNITNAQSHLDYATTTRDIILASLAREQIKEAKDDRARFTRELKQFSSPSYGVPIWVYLIKKLSRGRLEVKWRYDTKIDKAVYVIRRRA